MIENRREIILDTETTGLDPRQGHRVIEIGCVEMINKVLTGKTFHYYINPERDVPIEAFQVHGISGEFLKDKHKFSDIAELLLEFIGDTQLVIHNASFDLNFLNYELSLLQRPSIDFTNVVDTLQIARKLYPGAKNNLDALCRRFKIDVTHRQYHGALKDARLLAEIYVELTGGRQIKFAIQDDDTHKFNHNSINSNATILINTSFKTLPPTEEELSEHRKFINKISNNLW